MEVNPSFPAKTVSDFIAYSKKNPGKVNMAAVPGGTTQLYGELFKVVAGVDIVPVYYRGPAPAMTDLITGQVHVMFDSLVSSLEHIRAGELRPLAVTSPGRLEVLPGVPTVGEFVHDYEATGYTGIGVPKNTPQEVVDKLNREINSALVDPRMKARLVDLGYEPFALSPTNFGKLLAEETDKWGRTIRAANIKAR
jgi:tripartite-type tricarboxylate transporter receptor subunit TctC